MARKRNRASWIVTAAFALLSLSSCVTAATTINMIPATRPGTIETGTALERGELYLGGYFGGADKKEQARHWVSSWGISARYGLSDWLALSCWFDKYVVFDPTGCLLDWLGWLDLPDAYRYPDAQYRIGVGSTLRLLDVGPLKCSLTAGLAFMDAVFPGGPRISVFSTPLSLNVGLYPITHLGLFVNGLLDSFWGFDSSNLSSRLSVPALSGGVALDFEGVKIRAALSWPVEGWDFAPAIHARLSQDVLFGYYPSMDLELMVRLRHL